MQFKDISYLELRWPLCSAEQNHFCNYGRRHHEEQFQLGPVIQEMSFKGISYQDLLRPLCSAERNHLCNFEGGIMRNNSVKLFEFGPVVQEEMLFKDISYLEL